MVGPFSVISFIERCNRQNAVCARIGDGASCTALQIATILTTQLRKNLPNSAPSLPAAELYFIIWYPNEAQFPATGANTHTAPTDLIRIRTFISEQLQQVKKYFQLCSVKVQEYPGHPTNAS
jgi:hypothetical protein